MACSTTRFVLVAGLVFTALTTIYALAAIPQPSAPVIAGQCVLAVLAVLGCGYMLAHCER